MRWTNGSGIGDWGLGIEKVIDGIGDWIGDVTKVSWR